MGSDIRAFSWLVAGRLPWPPAYLERPEVVDQVTYATVETCFDDLVRMGDVELVKNLSENEDDVLVVVDSDVQVLSEFSPVLVSEELIKK